MDRRELCDALASAGVPGGLYEIPGFHEFDLRPPDFRYLRQEGDVWVVGNVERGVHDPHRRFDTEDAACRYLYDRLTDPGPAPGPGADEEMEAVLRDREEIRRAAHDSYERARRRRN
ncbi:hypothetical protein [Actinacidiphila glaucinigra]|uniref:Uncharacterized protein n=1 Tax=Actinacidiphila glaucinigra TaxID=235986 RepID=A0A238ZLS0_9ACTN|nr:hypothetical protein [Actinacidiphila glaucinigra]SNR84011.1 hypothetical protein SAMN05216252_101365 [Actinacidiphila glaucinigra]